MKTIILILLTTFTLQAQTITSKTIEIYHSNWSKPFYFFTIDSTNKVEVSKETYDSYNIGDWYEKPSGQGVQDTTAIIKEYEIVNAEYQKILKQLEELNQSKLRIEGVLMYLQEKYKQEIKK